MDGPSVTSFEYSKCTMCTDAWYRVPLYLFFEFFPITVFYLIILVLRISVTSPPVPCFIMCAQFVMLGYITNSKLKIFLGYSNDGDISLRVDTKIILTLYGFFNLDFFRYNILPPLCLTKQVKTIYIALLGYVSVIYPMLLIFLTWLFVELHGRNVRPLVWLWRPFHRCFVRLGRGWDTKSDIIDVFTTFFLLSYNKTLFLAMVFLTNHLVTNHNYNCTNQNSTSYILLEDTHYLIITSSVCVFSFVFVFVPPLLLFLYPFGPFRTFLSRCHLNSIVLHTFIEKIYGCYRNGLEEGGRDMRRFSSLYFALRILVYLVTVFSRFINKNISKFYFVGTFLFIITLLITFAKPYRKAYMNYLDVLLLLNLTLTCYTIALWSESMAETVRVLLALPLVVLIINVVLKRIHTVFSQALKSLNLKFLSHKCADCLRRKERSLDPPTAVEQSNEAVSSNVGVRDSEEQQPLISPTCSVISYGTEDTVYN